MSSDAFRRFSHRYRTFNSPVSEARLAAITDVIRPDASSEIVDFGCGTGEWLLRLIEVSGACGTGVDSDALALEEAARRSEARGLASRLHWREEAVDEHVRSGSRYSLALCVGAGHAFGGYARLLESLRPVVLPHGMLLVGEGFWERPPPAAYVEFLRGEEMGTHQDNVRLAEELGWECLWAAAAGLDEWDHFEWEFYRTAVEYAHAQPSEEAATLLDARRRWRDAYLQWGRGTMGFGYYVFRLTHS